MSQLMAVDSTTLTVVAEAIMFSGCLSLCPILENAMYAVLSLRERPVGLSHQVTFWWPKIKGRGCCDLTSVTGMT